MLKKKTPYVFQNSSGINMGNIHGHSPLHHAVVSGNIEVIKLLLENGAIPDIVDHRNKSPMDLTRVGYL